MRARAPASSANLGSGFDTLAVALDRFVEVEVEPATRLVVKSEGEGAGFADDSSHLAARVATEIAGTDRLAITVRSDIPVARGLGSSAALAAAAAAAAGARDPLAVAARIDGHPDNAAASVVGGLVAAARVGTGIRVVRLPLDVTLAFVVIVPGFTLSTGRARQVLPTEVPREHAAFNLSRLALLIAGLADSRVLIPEATEDRLHQDYRSSLFPAAPKLLSAMADGGAQAVCWSGAGPSLVGICQRSDAAAVRDTARQALAGAEIDGEVLVLRPDLDGLIVDGAPMFGGEGHRRPGDGAVDLGDEEVAAGGRSGGGNDGASPGGTSPARGHVNVVPKAATSASPASTASPPTPQAPTPAPVLFDFNDAG